MGGGVSTYRIISLLNMEFKARVKSHLNFMDAAKIKPFYLYRITSNSYIGSAEFQRILDTSLLKTLMIVGLDIIPQPRNNNCKGRPYNTEIEIQQNVIKDKVGYAVRQSRKRLAKIQILS